MQNVQLGDKRSVPLEPSDKKALKAILKYAGTQTAAAALLGIGRGTLIQALKPGNLTCGATTRQSIRDFAQGNPSIVKQNNAVA